MSFESYICCRYYKLCYIIYLCTYTYLIMVVEERSGGSPALHDMYCLARCVAVSWVPRITVYAVAYMRFIVLSLNAVVVLRIGELATYGTYSGARA